MPQRKATVTKSTTTPKSNKNVIISSNIESSESNENNELPVKPKRRGRPPSKKQEKPPPKKRGRKPKGGKIVSNNDLLSVSSDSKENIIVHLKCSTSLLNTQPSISCDINKINNTNNTNNTNNSNNINNNNINYFNINKDSIKINTLFEKANCNKLEEPTNNCLEMSNCYSKPQITNIDANNKNKIIKEYEEDNEKKRRKNENDIMDKLKEIQQNLKHDNVCLTESNCFWCTCSFENPPIHVPKYIIKETYHVYGCFCSPECATAFLFNENIDNSTKFERYSLLCSLYTKIFKYDRNIKPAPNPYYTLSKYCGNLSIMEYRELFNSNRFLFVIDKPLTRELPQLDIMDENVFN